VFPVETITVLIVAGIPAFTALGVPMAFSSGAIAVALTLWLFGPGALMLLSSRTFSFLDSYVLVSVPLFVLMASILERSGLARDLYTAFSVWAGRLRGGIAAMTTLVGVVLAATVGVIGGEIVVLGLVALPQLLRFGCQRRLAIGTICPAGSLGTMIPPSIILVFYGLTANVPVGDLFVATPLPGLLLAALCIGYILIPGMRPVVEIQIFDFVTLMMDAIVNQAAKFRFMLGGAPRVPVVFRGPQGGGIRLGAQHSQSLEAWFTHVPGLVVLAPSSPYDAKGLLAAAIRDDNPVVFLEHRLLYVRARGPVPAIDYAIPIGRAATLRQGRDVTIVATMAMVPQALKAATELARAHGIEAEVTDPRTLRPLDLDTILASVRRTHRLVVAQEGWTRWGFGAEVVAAVVEAAFDWLDAPPERVGMADVPMPYNDTLERAVIPAAADIVAAARRAMGR